jgi:catalase
MPPSTEWREQLDGDEERRFAAFAERIAALQQKKTQKYGSGRAFHRKQVVGLRARFEVLSDLPPHAAQGLFAKPGSYDAQVRLSNGGADVGRDRKPDVRGFGLRVLGVTGAGALGGTTRAQDFVMINRQVFGFSKPDEFIELALALFTGPVATLRQVLRAYGLFGGIKRMGELVRSMKQPFGGFATAAFFSAAPIANGPYAVRVRLLPQGATALGNGKSGDDLAADMRAQLQRGPLQYLLQLQFFTDEKTTPIEDAAVDWPESSAPYVTVGRLTIPQQSFDDAAAQALAKEIDRATFDPWEALVEHRPLGGIMRARKAAYFASQKARGVVS